MKLNAKKGKKILKEEAFDWRQLLSGLFNVVNPVKWAKTLAVWFNFRNLIIIGIIFGFAYYQGMQGKPVQMEMSYKEAVEIKVPNSDLRLYKPKNSRDLYWIDSKGNKTHVKVADVSSLQKQLRPYGIIIKPYALAGAGFGEDGFEKEFGGGFYWLKYYAWRLGNHLTNKGIYIGVGYKLEGLGLDNSAINISYGRGYKGDIRYLIGFTVNF